MLLCPADGSVWPVYFLDVKTDLRGEDCTLSFEQMHRLVVLVLDSLAGCEQPSRVLDTSAGVLDNTAGFTREEEEEGIRAAQQGFWASQKALANKTRHHTRLRHQSLHLPAVLTVVCCRLHGALKTMQVYRRCDAHLQNIIALAC